MTKNEFLHNLTTARQQWDLAWKNASLSSLPEHSAPGEMNRRDILYHVAWYEREMVEVLTLRALVGSPWWDLSQDERNAHILLEGQPVPAAEAFTQEQQVYAELLALLEKASDEELEQARFFADMPQDWKPWEMIASNTYEHYPDHL